MFIRLKLATGGEKNFIIANIVTFEPRSQQNLSQGSLVDLTNGESYHVLETCLSIRNALKKVAKGSSED